MSTPDAGPLGTHEPIVVSAIAPPRRAARG